MSIFYHVKSRRYTIKASTSFCRTCHKTTARRNRRSGNLAARCAVPGGGAQVHNHSPRLTAATGSVLVHGP